MRRIHILPLLCVATALAASCVTQPQPEEITSDPRENFLYGSIGGESERGIPYWIVMVLPRIFPEYLPGPGGYASLGFSWEDGKELPVGFTKRTIGFERVGFNCALCHVSQYRTAPDAKPVVVAAGGSHRADIQGLFEFFSRAANDPRFNVERILTEIDAAFPMPKDERLLYASALIPATKKVLAKQAEDLTWMDSRPRWGPGRDAPMNIIKFPLLEMADDGSIDHTKFPAIWHLAVREQPGRTFVEGTPPPLPADTMLLGIDGFSTSIETQVIDSAIGLGGRNTEFFHRRMEELIEWLRQLRPPPYPLAIDRTKASRGKSVYDNECAECHAPYQKNRLGTVIPIEDIGTDPTRMNAWTQTAADRMNEAAAAIGIQRSPIIKNQGYVPVHLDGLWLRGPYLHNGSVPTIRDLLKKGGPTGERPRTFCVGYDVLDRDNLGYISDERVHPRCAESGPPAQPSLWDKPATPYGSNEWPLPGIWKYYTSEIGNGNEGHEYGVSLSDEEKDDLIEYLKGL